MTVPPLDDVILGVTHLSIGGELVRLFKCCFCAFKNIHEDEIRHHIRWNENLTHKYIALIGIDADRINRQKFIVIKNKNKKQAHSSSNYTYTRKEDLPNDKWPWIKCPWCIYRHKLPRDLQRHFLEKHRSKLYNLDPDYHLDPSYSLHDIEWPLEKSLNFARKISGLQYEAEDEEIEFKLKLDSDLEKVPTAEELPEEESDKEDQEEEDEAGEEEGDPLP